jgi:hypothetical protein
VSLPVLMSEAPIRQRNFTGKREGCQAQKLSSAGYVLKPEIRSTKHEARSTKQIQNPNFQMFKTMRIELRFQCFGHWDFENLNLFRISIFGFGI